MAPPTRLQVNFFKPSTPGMKKEVGIASTILVIWALLSFGIPALIYLAVIAQGCTIGYIVLCKLYCVLWDKRITRR